MRKHTIIAYTLHEGDTLYYLDHNEVKSITLKFDQVYRKYHNSLLKPIVDDLLIKPDEKIQQTRNGQLILWRAYKTSSGIGMGYSEDVKYVEKKLKR